MNNAIRILLPLAALSGAVVWTVAQAPAKSAKKRVLVCTVTTGFRHSSIPYAEKTLEKLGADSEAFEVVDWARQPEVNIPKKPNQPKKPEGVPTGADDKAKAKYDQEMRRWAEAEATYQKEMAKWTSSQEAEAKSAQHQWDAQLKESLGKLAPEKLVANKIDAVIFANTTGDLPLPDREGFIKWIEDGHTFCAMHSGSDTFHGFRGYIDMLQGEFAGHGAQVPADLIKGDPKHPATAGLPDKWELKQEEMYIIKSQDRSKVRSLWFLRHHPNEVNNTGHFAVSWVREYGKGKVFYTSLGHREDLWSDAADLRDRKNPVETSRQYQQHLLGGIKWALGLAEGSAKPNPEVN